jgi:hypothetical protein
MVSQYQRSGPATRPQCQASYKGPFRALRMAGIEAMLPNLATQARVTGPFFRLSQLRKGLGTSNSSEIISAIQRAQRGR